MVQQDIRLESELISPLKLSTENMHALHRHEWLREVIGREYANVEIVPPRNQRLFNDMTIYSGDAMRLSVIHSNGITIKRLPQEPSHISQDAYFGVVLLEGEYLLEQNNREVFLKPGEMTIYDATSPHRIYCPNSFSKLIVSIPRVLMRDRMPGIEHCTALHIKGDQGAGRVASQFIQTVAQETNAMSLNTFNTVSENALDIFTLALNCVRPQNYHLSKSRSLSLYRVKRFVTNNISDPLLDTSAVEVGTGLSARYINELFQQEDTSLMRYVWNSRLANCHQDLMSINAATKRVSEIALRWGFNDFAHFSRAFKQKYGLSPREVKSKNH